MKREEWKELYGQMRADTSLGRMLPKMIYHYWLNGKRVLPAPGSYEVRVIKAREIGRYPQAVLLIDAEILEGGLQ